MEAYNEQERSGYIQIPVGDRNITTELSGDFTLPDYQPDIKRLLKITASVLPPSKYIGENEAEFAGNVDYYVLYTGSDNEIYCSPLTSEYKIDVPIEKNTDLTAINISGNASVTSDMISGRVISPRKINIKCRLKSKVQLFGDVLPDNGFGETDDGENEVLYGREAACRELFGVGELLRLTDDVIIDGRDGDTRVICADGKPLVTEVSVSAGAVSCRGELYLKLLMSKESGGEPYTALRKIPFSQTVPVDGAESGCTACACGTVTEMSIEVGDNRIAADIGVILEVSVLKNERVSYVKDVFSTTHKCTCEYKTLSLPIDGRSYGFNFTLSDSMTLDEAGISPECSVIDVTGTAVADGVERIDEKNIIMGRVRLNILLKRDGEYSCADIELPFRYAAEFKMNKNGIESDTQCSLSVVSARVRLDSERIGVDTEIGVCIRCTQNGSITTLESVSFGDELCVDKSEYVICYPSRDDSLWSVAKRYGAHLERLATANQLDRESAPDSHNSIDGVNYLVI